MWQVKLGQTGSNRIMIPSKAAKEQENGRKLKKVLQWPSQSPELGLVEILWWVLQRAVCKWMPANLKTWSETIKKRELTFLHNDTRDWYSYTNMSRSSYCCYWWFYKPLDNGQSSAFHKNAESRVKTRLHDCRQTYTSYSSYYSCLL